MRYSSSKSFDKRLISACSTLRTSLPKSRSAWKMSSCVSISGNASRTPLTSPLPPSLTFNAGFNPCVFFSSSAAFHVPALLSGAAWARNIYPLSKSTPVRTGSPFWKTSSVAICLMFSSDTLFSAASAFRLASLRIFHIVPPEIEYAKTSCANAVIFAADIP